MKVIEERNKRNAELAAKEEAEGKATAKAGTGCAHTAVSCPHKPPKSSAGLRLDPSGLEALPPSARSEADSARAVPQEAADGGRQRRRGCGGAGGAKAACWAEVRAHRGALRLSRGHCYLRQKLGVAALHV